MCFSRHEDRVCYLGVLEKDLVSLIFVFNALEYFKIKVGVYVKALQCIRKEILEIYIA